MILFGAAAPLLMPAQQAPQPPQPPRTHNAGAISVATSYLGVGIMDVDANRAKALKMNEARGAEVTQITPDSPAERAGLKINDVILEYDGQRVDGMEHLQTLVRQTAPGKTVKLGIWRNGAPMTVNARIELHREVAIEIPRGAWGVDAPDMWPVPMPIPQIMTVMQNPMLGVQCESLGDEQQFAEFFGVKDGLLVKAVTSDSPAARAGIKAGDVIVKIEDAHVGTMRELNSTLRSIQASQKPSFQVTVVRNKKEMPLTVSK